MSLANEVRLVFLVPVLIAALALFARARRASRHRRDVERTWTHGRYE